MTLQHIYNTDGQNAAFPFSFAIDQDSDLQVLLNSVEQTSGFTIHGAGSASGGVVAFLSTPTMDQSLVIRHRGTSAVSSGDASSGYLSDKLVAGAGISLTSQMDAVGRQVLVVANTDDGTDLDATQNLADLPDKEAARGHLGVYGKDQVYTKTETNAAIAASSDQALKKAQNLADLPDKAVARVNLGVYSTAQVDAAITSGTDQALKKAQNLADLPDKDAARANLGVYSTAQVDAAISNTQSLRQLHASTATNLVTLASASGGVDIATGLSLSLSIATGAKVLISVNIPYYANTSSAYDTYIQFKLRCNGTVITTRREYLANKPDATGAFWEARTSAWTFCHQPGTGGNFVYDVVFDGFDNTSGRTYVVNALSASVAEPSQMIIQEFHL